MKCTGREERESKISRRISQNERREKKKTRQTQQEDTLYLYPEPGTSITWLNQTRPDQ